MGSQKSKSSLLRETLYHIKRDKLIHRLQGEGKKAARVKIKVRKRVKIPCSQLFHILEMDVHHNCIPKNALNKYMLFGTVQKCVECEVGYFAGA
jgi:hypothetical protein